MSKHIRIYLCAFLLLLLYGCSKDIPIVNESDEYAVCNSRLSVCNGNQIGEYCLFGYKWGENQDFDEAGIEARGPQTKGGTITYSFQGTGHLINTHRQINVPSQSWNEILDCAQDRIRQAVSEWEKVADINFEELPANSDTDIQFYVAAILQSAVGFPNYQEDPCTILSGDVVFDANSKEKSCHGFYINALHEIGHVLGLGHVNSKNVMVTGESKFSFKGLQSGDIEGIIQLYGPR
ncbi:matrixin family metalloprotease [Fulvivirga sp. RKSG066]|uniref:matrixin family metalloprotease n=1 Tax=Fulvivirga aurantia TaxID=2529383 RepID=UPI0012BBCC1C|nr:matrixin family metalloprotease [Fulvivirga aurantia]MTI23281.1 matrixin family metalloprotease [Fulvivirga aurantia]